MKRILITLFAVLALAFANPSATTADKPDNPGQSQEAKDDKESCKKKSCGQPKGQSCKNPNPHKTWCGSGRDNDGDDDDDDDDKDKDKDKDNGNGNGGVLANTGV